jgi:hypothetical protein
VVTDAACPTPARPWLAMCATMRLDEIPILALWLGRLQLLPWLTRLARALLTAASTPTSSVSRPSDSRTAIAISTTHCQA